MLRGVGHKPSQAMVEFALVATLLLVLILGIIDISYLLASRTQVYQATRTAARFAATHPDAWDNSSHPSSSSIEGNLRATTTSIPNDDSHITISYWIATSSTSETECGYYSQASNSFIDKNGYTESTCLKVGTLVQVQATYSYTYITPLLKGTFHSITINAIGAQMEEVACSSGCKADQGGDGDGDGGDGNGGGGGGDGGGGGGGDGGGD